MRFRVVNDKILEMTGRQASREEKENSEGFRMERQKEIGGEGNKMLWESEKRSFHQFPFIYTPCEISRSCCLSCRFTSSFELIRSLSTIWSRSIWAVDIDRSFIEYIDVAEIKGVKRKVDQWSNSTFLVNWITNERCNRRQQSVLNELNPVLQHPKR